MLHMMTDLEDEENWSQEDEVEDVDSDVSSNTWLRRGEIDINLNFEILNTSDKCEQVVDPQRFDV